MRIGKSMKKVLVLLSTYNGEKYVETQVNSVLKQKNVDVDIFIRDDGSKDNTVAVIEKLNDSRISIFKEENKGATNSFFELIKKAPLEYDYYALCDQDDYWEEDKLYAAAVKLKDVDQKKPALYYSGQKLTDKNLQNISEHNIDIKRSLGANFVFNQMAGCTAVFNRVLLEKLKRYVPQNVFGHDVWCFKLCAATGGTIVVESKGHILYRQHGNNVVGLEDSFHGKMQRAQKYIFVYKDSSYAAEILKAYGTELDKEWKNFLELICKAANGNLSAKIKLLNSKMVYFNSSTLRVLFIVKVILGKT